MDIWMIMDVPKTFTHLYTQSYPVTKKERLPSLALPRCCVAEATLAWTDRPAPWRPRHVSTVARASPPRRATTFARNAAQLQRTKRMEMPHELPHDTSWYHWWLGNYMLVGGLEHSLFSTILGIVIPIDFHIFQRGGSTTNQIWNSMELWTYRTDLVCCVCWLLSQ